MEPLAPELESSISGSLQREHWGEGGGDQPFGPLLPAPKGVPIRGPPLKPAHQVVVGPDAEKLPEVAEGHGGVGLEAEVVVVVGRGQVAAFAAGKEGGEVSTDYMIR